MINTTLNAIREHSPCEGVWEKLLKSLGKTQADDEPLPLVAILDSNGIDDAIWCLRVPEEEEHRTAVRLFTCDVARGVLHIFEKQSPNDKRPRHAIEIARRYALGKATKEELDAAWAAARDAAEALGGDAARAAEAAAWAAVWDAAEALGGDAARAARAARAAWAAVWDAAWDAAWDAEAAAWDAAWTTAGNAEKDRQAQLFIKYFGKEPTDG
jgi:hypothetical protein